jgi:polyvinyl alcohol dehydrogenase (cytochrome)
LSSWNKAIAFGCVVLTGLVGGPERAYGACDGPPGLQKFYSQTWGIDYGGQRYQSASNTTIGAHNAAGLELKWVYGLADDTPRGYPLVTEDTIFVADTERGVVALDRATGCVRWENLDAADVASAIVHEEVEGRRLLFLTGRLSGVYAIDAETGETVWHSEVEAHPVPMYSGSPIAYRDKVFVPISSLEIGLTINPFYGCCTTSGGMAALDSATGEQLWYRPTVEDAGQVTGRRWLFIEERGPSGAPVWGAPMLDVERGLVFYGSGQNYSRPASLTSDAIFAVDAASGEPRWVQQFTADDAYNIACETSSSHPNCPEPMGPDVDFGAPPILVTRGDGEDLLLAGQKSGDVYAIKPDDGETVWSTRFGRGGPLGGVHWGMAVDPNLELLYVPISDRPAHPKERPPAPGLYALDINDGSLKWSVARESDCESCWPGLSAAITAGPGIVVAGGLDGRLDIYAGATGKVLWSFDSVTDFDSVNGVPTRGGGFDAHGAMLADNLLIVASGYGSFSQLGGNALLVFAVEDER